MNVLAKETLSGFKRFTSDEQRHVATKLERFIEVIRTGTYEQKRAIGVYNIKHRASDYVKRLFPDWQDRAILDQCYWQLARFYRVCRIVFGRISA